MRIKSMNIINQLPIGVVGKVVHINEVDNMTLTDSGVIVEEKKVYGGRVLLVPWTNISSIEVLDYDEQDETINDVNGIAGTESDPAVNTEGSTTASACRGRGRTTTK